MKIMPLVNWGSLALTKNADKAAWLRDYQTRDHVRRILPNESEGWSMGVFKTLGAWTKTV